MALISVALLLGLYVRHVYGYLATADGLFSADGIPLGRDYVNVWTAARIALEGGVADLADPIRFHALQEQLLGRPFELHNWSYPPHLIPLILGLGLLSYAWGFVAWSGGTFAIYATAALAGQPRKWPLVTLLLLAPSTFFNLIAGQNGFLTGALLIGGLRLMDRRPGLAGILFGLLTVKPQLGLLLPVALVAAGAWRAILSAAITAAVMAGISMALFGIEPWIAYVQQAAPFQRAILEHAEGSFVLMMPTPFMAARLLGWGITAGYWLSGVAGLAAATIVFWSFRRTSLPNSLRGAIFLTATLLATPYAFNYDMPALSAALATFVTLHLRARLRPGELLALVAAWTLPLSVMMMNGNGLPAGPLILAAMLAFLLLRVRDVANSGAPTHTSNFLPASPGH
ncbi:MAG TPA: glycosyltransferase family 87 protein [Dongiaceae bacterium]|nr:glycosyltransferase family 87 protein [Dongiaceae bacterium]